jgi:hypothetical protein
MKGNLYCLNIMQCGHIAHSKIIFFSDYSATMEMTYDFIQKCCKCNSSLQPHKHGLEEFLKGIQVKTNGMSDKEEDLGQAGHRKPHAMWQSVFSMTWLLG